MTYKEMSKKAKFVLGMAAFLSVVGFYSVAHAAPTTVHIYATSTPGCIGVSADGTLWSNGSACGTGGGGGSGGISNPFFTVAGGNATTTLDYFYNGIYSNAASTTITYASTTAISSQSICFTSDICRTTWPTGGGSGSVGTSTADTSGQITFFTSNNATPALIGGSSSFTWSTSANRLTATYASTTALTVGTQANITTLVLSNALTVANGGTGAQTLTGCLTGNGTGAITGSGTCNTSNATVSSVATNAGLTGGTITTTGTIGLDTTAILNGLLVQYNGTRLAATGTPSLSVGYLIGTSTATSTFAGGVNMTGNDCFAIQGTCLQTYIQAATAYKSAANYATAAVLPGTPTYSNGSAGVGATLTELGFGALSVDGQVVSIGQRILVKNEATQANNGVYTVTATGSGVASYILTRSTDFNTSNDVYAGATVPVLAGGTTNGDTSWVESNTGLITIGTTNITFIESSVGTAGVTSVTATWPVISSGGTTPNITFGGLSTTTNLTAGQIPYNTGVNTFGQVATTTLTGTAPITFSQPITVIGPSASVLTCATATGLAPGCLSIADWNTFNNKVGTSTVPTLGRLAAWSGNGTPSTLYDVATSSETCSAPLSCGTHVVLTGGGAISIPTGTGNADGYLALTDWNKFNNKVGTSSVPTLGQLGMWTGNGTPSTLGSVATTTIQCTGNVSCTTFSGIGAASSIALTGTIPFANGGTNNATGFPMGLVWSNGSSLFSTSSAITVGSIVSTTTASSTFIGGIDAVRVCLTGTTTCLAPSSASAATKTFISTTSVQALATTTLDVSTLTNASGGTPSQYTIMFHSSSTSATAVIGMCFNTCPSTDHYITSGLNIDGIATASLESGTDSYLAFPATNLVAISSDTTIVVTVTNVGNMWKYGFGHNINTNGNGNSSQAQFYWKAPDPTVPITKISFTTQSSAKTFGAATFISATSN